MNYLTNYYRTKAELLEKKINALQRNISFLMERAETPSLQMREPTFDQADAPVSAPFSKNALAGPQSTGTSNTTLDEIIRERYQVLDAINQLFFQWYLDFFNTNGRHPTNQEMIAGYEQIRSQNANFSPQYLAWVQESFPNGDATYYTGGIGAWGPQDLEHFLVVNGYNPDQGFPWRDPDSAHQNEEWHRTFWPLWADYMRSHGYPVGNG